MLTNKLPRENMSLCVEVCRMHDTKEISLVLCLQQLSIIHFHFSLTRMAFETSHFSDNDGAIYIVIQRCVADNQWKASLPKPYFHTKYTII